MTRGTTRRLLSSTALIAVVAMGLTFAGPARPASPQALSLDELKSCLCQEQQIQRMRQEVDLRAKDSKQRAAELASMKRDLALRYTQVDTYEELSVEQYKYRFEQKERLQHSLNASLSAQLAAVNKLNAAVATYNAQCTTRPMIKSLVEKAKQNLICPASQ